jgi:hypothetical protein
MAAATGTGDMAADMAKAVAMQEARDAGASSEGVLPFAHSDHRTILQLRTTFKALIAKKSMSQTNMQIDQVSISPSRSVEIRCIQFGVACLLPFHITYPLALTHSSFSPPFLLAHPPPCSTPL